MSSDSTAQKYAEALYGIGKSSAKLETFQANAEDFLRILQGSKELMTSLSHPNIRRLQRKAIINEVLSQCDYDPVFSNFIRLVVDRSRITHYPKIVSRFIGMREEADGRVHGVVYSATPLSASQKEKLRLKAQSQLGREVILEEKLDESLIGGLRLEINGRVYDSSVKRHLERIRESISDKRN